MCALCAMLLLRCRRLRCCRQCWSKEQPLPTLPCKQGRGTGRGRGSGLHTRECVGAACFAPPLLAEGGWEGVELLIFRRSVWPPVGDASSTCLKHRPANITREKHRVQGALPLDWAVESAGQSRRTQVHRGKSGLHRAECQVTPGQRELTASATESRPPNGIFGCAW
jgi:hypothetical protein